MLITTVCPRCETNYQVQDSLRGKPMRCPQPTCKHIFIVEAPPAAEPPNSRVAAPVEPPRSGSRSAQQSGSVGDLIPLLPLAEPEPVRPVPTHITEVLEVLEVESVEPEPEPKPRSATPTWMAAPPPVRRGSPAPAAEESAAPAPQSRKAREAPRTSLAPEEPPEVLREAGHHSFDPPPVRRGRPAEVERAAPRPPSQPAIDLDIDDTDSRPEPAYEYETTHAPRGRWAKWIILPLVVLTVGALAGGGFLVFQKFKVNEDALAAEADKQYKSGLFRDAKDRYDNLFKNFSASEKLDFYKFRAELSGVRHRAGEKPETPEVLSLLDHIEQFIKDNDGKKDNDGNQLLVEHGADIGETLIKLLDDFCEGVGEPTDEQPLKVIARARAVIETARRIKLPPGTKEPDWAKLDLAFAKVESAVALMKQRKAVIARLAEIARKPSYAAIRAAEALVRDETPNLPGLDQLPEVKNLVDSIRIGHKNSVRFVTDPPNIPPATPDEEDEPSILFDPRTQGTPGKAPPEDRIFLALARGLLCAGRQTDGRIKFARRVGIDTTELPVRVPASLGSSERILVLSSDTSTLTALDVNGTPLWRYRLGTPSLGTPVVVDQRAYLATYNGEVHEIELVTGKLLGRFLLGQALTLGGTREPGTHRVFFAAAEGCVYVLDVRRHVCDMILYTNHPGGSLRCAPVIVAPEGEDAPGFLVLNQTNGLGGVQLRVFTVPLNDRNAANRPLEPRDVFEETLNPKIQLEGWTWFPPYHDPEKMVMVSDMGMLGLFGIRQPRNDDKPLFPFLPGGSLLLRPLMGAAAGAPQRAHGRAEVAQVQGNDLWLLSSDHLQRLRLAWGLTDGPCVVPAWPTALEIGSPLHRSQIVEGRDGRTSLITVTRPARRSTCWVTSVSSRTGDVHWRRQLGLVCVRAPVPVKMPAGPPMFLALDQGGALLQIDPQRYLVKPDEQWLFDSDVAVADSLEENATQEPVVLPAADGKSVYVVACPGNGLDLVVRHVKPAGGDPEAKRRFEVNEGKVRLPAALSGTPAVVGPYLMIPLANGVLARVPVPLVAGASAYSGPNWRPERADPDARAHVIALGGDHFLVTDGGRGLTHWNWPAGGDDYQRLPAGTDEVQPTRALDDRIVSLPLRLPGSPTRVCVADAGGQVSLFDVKGNGALEPKKSWAVGGIVTAGPYIAQSQGALRIGVVVERSRLVWIDPARGVLWTYPTAENDPIIGQPRDANGMVVVADQSGLYVALNPKNGDKLGPGYRLHGSIAPVASPVAFNKDRLLAPLSDGTVMLLSAWKLVKK